MAGVKLSVFLVTVVRLWHWVWPCCSYTVSVRQAESWVLCMLPWHKKLPEELSVAGSSIGPNSKTWKLESLSLEVLLHCLLIYSVTSMTLNSWLIKVCVFSLSYAFGTLWKSDQFCTREAIQIDFLLCPLGLGNEGKEKSGALKLGATTKALWLTSCTA